MLKKIKYIFLFIFSVSTITISAQRDTTLTQEVEVTKAYNPTIIGANKINEMPKLDETEHQIPTFNYSISSQPIINAFSVNPLKAATIRHQQKKETGYGLIRAGLGNYNKPYGEFFFNSLISRNSAFGIHARHLSSYGNLKLDGGDKVDAPFSENEAQLFYKHNFRKSILSVDVNFDRDGFNYYGYPVKPIPSVLLEENQKITYQGVDQAFTKGGIFIRLKNPVAELDDPLFNFDLKYDYFENKTRQFEHFGELKTDFRKPFDTGALQAEIGVNYIQRDGAFISPDIDKQQQTLLFLKPSYVFGGKTASISIGFNGWFDMEDDKDAVVKVAPNVRLDYMPVKDVISVYAGVDGNYINNHYSKIAYENPFVDPLLDVSSSFEKLHFYGGIDGKFSSKTNFKIGVDYSMIDNQQYYYLNEYYYPEPSINPDPLIIDNTFDVLYDNVNVLKFNVEVFHTSSEKLDILISGNYFVFNLEEQTVAWNTPSWDATFSLDYKITEQLSVGTDIYLLGGRKALIKEWPGFEPDDELTPIEKSYFLDAAFDLNVNANYQITEKFAVFGQLNNFGFQQYQRWFGYPVQSFNGLVGISYAF